MKKNTCIFMGTPQIAATVLSSMLEHGISVDLVVTQPDKKVGRKQKIQYSPVKEVALEHNIPVFQPIRIREDHQEIIDLNPDVIVTCAYGQILPEVILNTPQYGCVNLHGSLLPKYRGGAPIQRAIWNGDKKTGMSLMKMAKRMDAGPVLDVEEIEIEKTETTSTLFEKMAIAASHLIVRDYDLVCSNQATYKEQDESQMVLAPIILKEEEHIDFSKEDHVIDCQIRALASKPGAYGYIGKKKFKILKAFYEQGNATTCGEILGWKKDAYAISLHEGILYVQECQMEGKPAMDSHSFYNGQGRNLVGKVIL